MWTPSLTSVLSVLFLAYMSHALYHMASLFIHPECEARNEMCLENPLSSTSLSLVLFTTSKARPSLSPSSLSYVGSISEASEEKTATFAISLPHSVSRNNGSLYLVLLAILGDEFKEMRDERHFWQLFNAQKATVVTDMASITEHQVPKSSSFNLLGASEEESSTSTSSASPVPHVRSRVSIALMMDSVLIPKNFPNLLPEIAHLIGPVQGNHYKPIVYIDQLSFRLRDLVEINSTSTSFEVEFTSRPMSWGQLRLFVQFETALRSLRALGFTSKDVDEVKSIFADTNLYLLLVTFAVSAVHILFDVLAFKNDIAFWRGRDSLEGLSSSTLLWRSFSQLVIFLYLVDEETSLLVLVPSGMATLIEAWKLTKVFKVHITFRGFVPRLSLGSSSAQERTTEQLDSQSMRYLSILLVPLLMAGAVYSLLYTPHKSWYSWTLESLVNGVYAFGFLFMLPQLFVNYKLKSVAHLPWRAFMYKAFNTFIDDLFAFIITMPTAHRVACFRDDVVFLVYLYQRYLYPVDKNRLDEAAATVNGQEDKKKK